MSSLLSQVSIPDFPNVCAGTPAAKVLIADAAEDYRQLYSDLFQSAGYQTFCAKDSAHACAVLDSEKVDIALVDVMLGNDGISLYRKLKSREETRGIPVLLVSSNESHQNLLEIETGTDVFLKKPVRNLELIVRARNLLDRQRFRDGMADVDRALLTLVEVVEAKNPATAGHAFRVCRTAVALAIRVGLSWEEREVIRRGALLHDVGKVGVPDEILMRVGPLSSEDRMVLNSHTYLGERLCAPLASFGPLLQIIRNHHERLDGSGYPDGLRGHEISMATRVVALADVYDGLTTMRPYRGDFSHAQAMHQIRREAEQGWWDIALVDAMGRMGTVWRVPGSRA